MRKTIVISVIVILSASVIYYFFPNRNLFSSNDKSTNYLLPKAAFITSGTIDGNGILPSGAVVALQTFSKLGIYTEISSRDILLDPKALQEYSILILSTAIDYYDIDRKYSLSYMSDMELNNLKDWTANGGVLVAGDNIGRNTPNSSDRANLFGSLNSTNWALADCFGVTLKEKNVTNFHINGNINNNLNGLFLGESASEQWVLVVDSVQSKTLKSLAIWTDGRTSYPALIENYFEKGIAFLLPTSYLLHPANDGGKWGVNQIANFYKYVVDEFYSRHNNKVVLNPWPDGFNYAFCVTINSNGERADYNRLLSYLKSEKITPTFFVDGFIGNELKDYLSSEKIYLESNGFKKTNYRGQHSFTEIKTDILNNKNYWNKPFIGFKFPYSRISNWGIMALNDMDYLFDSSIGADNINTFKGSVIPYHLPFSYGQYYKRSNILEISPTLHDDFHFYQTADDSSNIVDNSEYQEKQAKLFEKYLLNFWNYSVKPFYGCMVFLGHPLYTANNDITLQPLKNLIQNVKKDSAWITTIENIAEFRNNLGELKFNIKEQGSYMEITVDVPPNTKVEGITLRLDNKPSKVKISNGDYKLIEKGRLFYLCFTAELGQKIELRF